MFPLGSCIGSAYEFFIRHLKCWIPLHDEPIFCQFNFFHCPNVGVLATVKVLALSSDIYWSVAFQCMHAHFAKCFAHTIFSLLQRRMFCHWPDRRSGQQTRERLEPWDQGWIIFWMSGCQSPAPRWSKATEVAETSPDELLEEKTTGRKDGKIWTLITFSVDSYLLEGDGLETNGASLFLHDIAGIESDMNVSRVMNWDWFDQPLVTTLSRTNLLAHQHPMLQEWL